VTIAEVRAVAAKLHEIVAWADIYVGDFGKLALMELAVKDLCRSDADVVVAGMRCFIEECCEAEGGFRVSAMSKLFVVNRYLFDVPEFTPLNQRRFGAFAGVPVHGDLVNELWPWQVDARGEIRLIGFFRGYVGETYLALQEAVAFKRRYGLREKREPTRRLGIENTCDSELES